MLRLLLVSLLSVLIAAPQATTPASQETPSHVLLISIDGARPDAIQQLNTPHIDALAERGASDWDAVTTLPPVTLPSHASMLTGMDVEEHGIDYNSYALDPINTPTFLKTTHDAGYPTAMVAGKNKLEQLRQDEAIPFVFARSGDPSVVNAALDLLDEGYTVLFVHFPNPDYFGHLSGWMGLPYLASLEETDRQVGRLMTWYEENDLLDETLVILTADHGGHNFGHGQDIPDDTHIPWIIAGPGIKSDYAIESQVTVTDTAHTILYALGLETPESKTGQVVMEVFVEEETGE